MEPNLSLCKSLEESIINEHHHNNVKWPIISSIANKPTSICGSLSAASAASIHYLQTTTTTTSQHRLFYQELITSSSNQSSSSFDSLAGASMKSLPLTELSLNHLIEPLENLDSNLDYIFHGFWLKSGDERTSRLPFMAGGPWKLLFATAIYLYLIKRLLPRLMSQRSTINFELQWLIRAYNLLMVCANMYAFYHGLRILDYGRKCFGCNKTDTRSNKSPEAWELLHYGWLFMLSRLVEWLDTIFFVLRKRQRQVTKLHVFHHSFVPLLSWFYLKFYPDVTMAFFPLVNTLVHTVMYGYYFLATFGPKIQAYLWWKKYLTTLQILQFVAILIQLASIPLSGDPACQYPRSFLLGAISGATLFLFLFYTYYNDTYRQPATSKITSPNQSNSPFQKQLEQTKQTRELINREGSSNALSELIDNCIDVNVSKPTSNSSSYDINNQKKFQ